MAYDHGGLEALKPRPSGGRKRENMALEEEKALLARFAKAASRRPSPCPRQSSNELTRSARLSLHRHSPRSHRGLMPYCHPASVMTDCHNGCLFVTHYGN
jgi:hypothetical protein